MKFVTIRELRSKTATIRKDLDQEREIVLTANGRPFAVVTPVEPDSVEEELQAIRRARAKVAVERIRSQAKAKGLDRLTTDEIDAIVEEIILGPGKKENPSITVEDRTGFWWIKAVAMLRWTMAKEGSSLADCSHNLSASSGCQSNKRLPR